MPNDPGDRVHEAAGAALDAPLNPRILGRMDRRLLLALSLLALACSPGGIGVTGEDLGDGGSETGGGGTGNAEDCEFPDKQVIADLDAIVAGTLA